MDQLYRRWNTAIARHFFRDEREGKQVFLFVDDRLLRDLADEHELAEDSFITAVSPPDLQPADVARRCLAQCRNGAWRHVSPADHPPYLAYLALFVLAAGQDQSDLRENAYYDRLRRYLNLPDGTRLPEFNRLGDVVWKDLENWSTYDMDGRLGIFTNRIHGQQRHVGIPRSQTLLWEEELRALPTIFASAELGPTDDPTDYALVRALEGNPHELRTSTRRTLLRAKDDVIRAALLEAIRAELVDWDGHVDIRTGTESHLQVFGGLKIFLDPNFGNRTGSSSLRCTLATPYPDRTLELTDGHSEYTCDELAAPWSTRLASDNAGRVNAAHLNWNAGLTLVESTSNWKFKLKGASVRVFESAENCGLPGWAETSRLQKHRRYLIACQDLNLAALSEWGSKSCAECRQHSLFGLLPQDWSLLEVRDVLDDLGIREINPAIGFASEIQIRLVGGVRSGRTNTYFAFAPPTVQFAGLSGSEIARLGDIPLDISTPDRVLLPGALPCGQPLTITVLNDDHVLKSQSLLIREEVDWTAVTGESRVDTFGYQGAQPGISGAYADPPLVSAAKTFQHIGIYPARNAILLGRRPGQISVWPADKWPEWEPIWAITPSVHGRKHREVFYCGSDVADSRPMRDPSGDSRKQRKWKEQLWGRRKRNIPPTSLQLRTLWNEFVEAGRW